MIFIRLATPTDLPRIIEIITYAKQTMRLQGNLTQWTNNYPSEEVFLHDIQGGHCFVCSDKQNGLPEACFCHLPGPEPNYTYIEQGTWPNDKPYYVLHRIASSGKLKGIGETVIHFCLKRYPILRIDTHTNNHTMNHLLTKCKFTRCGIIYVNDGTARIAYEKQLSEAINTQ